MIPEAYIGHHSQRRLRIRIADRRGDDAYFDEVQKRLAAEKSIRSVRVNPLTGSVLVQAPAVDARAIAEAGDAAGLFSLVFDKKSPTPVAKRVVMPLDTVSKGIDRMTRGDVDLSGLIFLLLLGFGLYEIARGRFRPPPWYTAFWYAFGVFTKSMVDRSGPSG